MQICIRAKRQRCKIANALSCTIGLGNDRPATRGECGTGMYKIGKASLRLYEAYPEREKAHPSETGFDLM